jgi:hypothetical protein
MPPSGRIRQHSRTRAAKGHPEITASRWLHRLHATEAGRRKEFLRGGREVESQLFAVFLIPLSNSISDIYSQPESCGPGARNTPMLP